MFLFSVLFACVVGLCPSDTVFSARSFVTPNSCVVAEVDADSEKNRPLGTKYEVSGFPTLKFFPKGSAAKTPEDYDGGRTAKDFTEFLNEKCGTHRSVTGGLNELVRGVFFFDAIIGHHSLLCRLDAFPSWMSSLPNFSLLKLVHVNLSTKKLHPLRPALAPPVNIICESCRRL